MYQNYYERTLSIRYFDVAHRSCTRVGKQVPRLSLMFDYTERFYPKRAMSATRWRPTKHTAHRPRREALSTARYSLYSHVGWVKPFWCTIASTGSPRYCGVIHTFCWGVYIVSHQLFSQWVSAWWTTETRLNSAYFYPSLLWPKAGNNAIFHELG